MDNVPDFSFSHWNLEDTQSDESMACASLLSLLEPCIESTIIAAEELIGGGELGTGSVMHGTIVRGLQQLDRATRDGRPRVMLLPEPRPCHEKRFREDWLDVVGGGNGCWATAPDDDDVRIALQRRR